MTPRNQDESSEETVQDKSLQPSPEAPNDKVSAQEEPAQQDAPVLTFRQKEIRNSETETELDRVEIYFKGPTAFSA